MSAVSAASEAAVAERAVALCAARLAAGDRDRFAATMAAPAPHRPGLLALYAANLELAHAPWAASEPLVAEIRLQWWIEALEALSGRGVSVPHDIGPALAALPAAALAGLIAAAEARRADCWSDPFETEAQLWAYLEASSGQVYAAAGAVLGLADTAALRAFGQAAGLAQWLVALPMLRARRRLCLAAAAQTEGETLAALAGEGLARLEAAAQMLHGGPPAARLAALPGWQARAILRRAAARPGRILAGELGGSEFARRFGLLRARLAV